MKITEALFSEHLVFHNLFDHIEKVVPKVKTVGEIKLLASVVESMLSAHSQTEDELFISPLGTAFEQIGHRDTFHHEHDLIETNLALIQKTRQLKDSRHLLLTTVVMCRNHMDKEERVVFPMAERILKSKTLLELGQTWKNQRSKMVV